MPNTAGRGERVSTDFIYGSKNAVGWSLNLIKPLFGSLHFPLVLLQASLWQCISVTNIAMFIFRKESVIINVVFCSVYLLVILCQQMHYLFYGCLEASETEVSAILASVALTLGSLCVAR